MQLRRNKLDRAVWVKIGHATVATVRSSIRLRVSSLRGVVACAVIIVALTAGCGTYSTLRGGDTLAARKIEVQAGVAANSNGEVQSVVQLAARLTDRVELGAQYEVLSALAWARFGVLQTKVHHVGLAFTAGGGYATTLLDNDETSSGGVVMGGVTVGGRYSWVGPNHTSAIVFSGIRVPAKRSSRLKLAYVFILDGTLCSPQKAAHRFTLAPLPSAKALAR